MPPKKGGPAAAKVVTLTDEQRESILQHMSDRPCINCTDNHEAYNCKKMSGPMGMMSWIHNNFSTPPTRIAARAFVIKLQGEKHADTTKASTAGAPAIPRDGVPSAAVNEPSYGRASASPSIQVLVQRPAQPSVQLTLQPADVARRGSFAPNTYGTSLSPGGAHEGRNLLNVSSVMMGEPVDIKAFPAQNPDPSKSVGKGSVFRPQYIPYKDATAPFPLRQKLSPTQGEVTTNHFQVGFAKDTQFFVYQIVGVPTSKNKRKSQLIFKTAIQAWRFLKNNQDNFATDNLGKIVAWRNLHDTLGDPDHSSRETNAEYTGDDDNGYDEWYRTGIIPLIADGVSTVSLKFRFCGKLNIDKIQAYIDPSRRHNYSNLPTFNFDPTTTALNAVISKSLTDDVFQVSANKFFLKSGYAPLETDRRNANAHALCTIRGYFYTIKPGMGKVLLNINAATSAFHTPMRVDHFMTDDTFPANERENILKKLRVYIDYDRKTTFKDAKEREHIAHLNKRQKRIKTISSFGPPISHADMKFKKMIKNADGESEEAKTYTRIIDHMYEVFGVRPKPGLKMVNVGTDENPCYYPQEFLSILPYQIYKKLIPDDFTTGMLRAACHTPQHSRLLIESEGLTKLGLVPCNGLQAFPKCPQLLIEPAMLQIPCSRMNKPVIHYAHSTRDPDASNAKWNLKGNVKFLESPKRTQPLRYYMLAELELKGRRDTISAYQRAIDQQVRQYDIGTGTRCLGMQVMGAPRYNMTHTESWKEYGDAIHLLQRQAPGGTFVFLVLASKHIGRYSAFKDVVDRYFGLQSICLTEKPNFYKGALKTDMQIAPYIGNVMMKVNLKTGGRNHTAGGSNGSSKVESTLKDTLVIGADVTHPGPGSLVGCPSIAAVVGSVDPAGGKFLGSMRLQHRSNTEMIDELEAMVIERLTAYKKARNVYPKSILYYRDGVSTGQYAQVKHGEIRQIKAAFKTATNTTLTSLTAVVAVKRHHTRLYPVGHAMANGNCQPGTLVDSGITSPYFGDFYLQSHHGLQGTAIPTHYFVLENGMGLTDSALQDLTHKLCYTYVRATMGVSYAPPAYYADRLCERGRCYLRPWFAPEKNGNHFNAYAQEKAKIEKRFADQMRNKVAGLPMVETRAGQRKPRKTEAAQDVERKVKDAARKAVEENVMEEARKYLVGKRSGGPGPWHEALDDTMFWM